MMNISFATAGQQVKTSCQSAARTLREKVQAFCRTVEKTDGYKKVKATLDNLMSCFQKTPIHERSATDNEIAQSMLQSRAPRKSFREGVAGRKEQLQAQQRQESARRDEEFSRKHGVKVHESLEDFLANAPTKSKETVNRQPELPDSKSSAQQTHLNELLTQLGKVEPESRKAEKLTQQKKVVIGHLLSQEIANPGQHDLQTLANGIMKCKKSSAVEARVKWSDVPAAIRAPLMSGVRASS